MAKKKFAVLTDSACDLPPDLAEKSGVDIMNFQITVDGVSYTERVDFSFDEYYDMLRTCEKVPSTAHVTQARFLDAFERYAEEGVEKLLYVSINRSGSATYDASVMARDKFCEENPGSPMKIYIMDSGTYSMGYGLFVAEAARKLANGAQMADVMEWLQERFDRMEIVLAAFSLKFMKKSGRISAAAAFAGELLGLRPIISLIHGKSVVEKKVRGDKEVLPAMMDWARPRMDPGEVYGVGGTADETIQSLAALCEKKWKKKPAVTFKLGAAVATNTGPDAIAIIYLRRSEAESLLESVGVEE